MAQSLRHCYCSVPQCSNNKRKFPYLSFHDFPTDVEIRARWVTAIRRDEGPNFKIRRGCSYVCSQHFSSEETYVSASGRKKLKKGAYFKLALGGTLRSLEMQLVLMNL
uniref:THAP domain-containing protein 1 n=1 Tax=Fundulus heteroclitus TaxID=8078 RepID=A0A3Q2Q6B7_FUNHE